MSATRIRGKWFGREEDGCADLVVIGMFALPGTLAPGQMLAITHRAHNIGSATAGASTTRYYLSRDSTQSADDILLNAETAVQSLNANATFVNSVAAEATIPSSASGTYHLLACADDRSVVTEITDTNNCFLSTQTIRVEVP